MAALSDDDGGSFIVDGGERFSSFKGLMMAWRFDGCSGENSDLMRLIFGFGVDGGDANASRLMGRVSDLTVSRVLEWLCSSSFLILRALRLTGCKSIANRAMMEVQYRLMLDKCSL